MNTPPRLACALLIVATVLDPRSVQAQPTTAEILYIEGDRHFALREFDQAIEKFRAAYLLDPQPLFLFNIAQAYLEKGTCDEAEQFYLQYLSANTDDQTVRATARQRVAEIDAGTSEACREPATGPATTTGTAPEVTARRDPERMAPPPAPGRGKRTAGLIAITAGVFIAGTGGYFSSVARGAARDLEDRCTPGCDADDADIAGLDAEGKTAQRNATLLYGAGGVAVVAGAALLTWGVLDGRTSARHVALVPARSGAIAVAGWSF